MELRLYLQMVQRGWWIVVLTALSALGMALLAIYLVTPVYRSTARFVVSPSSELSRSTDVLESLATLDRRSIVSTYAEVLNSENVYRQTLDSLQLRLEEMEDYKHATVVLPSSNVLELWVEGPDPELATLLANSLGQHAVVYIESLNQVFAIRILDPAIVPIEPIRPQPLRDSALALALGIVLGAVLAIVRGQLLIPIEAFIQQATVDEDSSAYKRRYFELRMEEALSRSVDGSFSIGLIQLEGLQGFVDNVPKPIAQEVLRRATKVLSNELRGNDSVGRWNRTSFAVLLPETPGEAAVSTLGRVQIALSKPLIFGQGESIHLRPYIGVAERRLGESSTTLVEWAEAALKQATGGEAHIVLYKTAPFMTA